MPPTPPFAATDAEYEAWARQEAAHWKRRVLKPAGPVDRAARGLQQKINQAIPEKVHAAVTAVIERLTRTILTGADLTTGAPLLGLSLRERDERARRAIEGYRCGWDGQMLGTTASAGLVAFLPGQGDYAQLVDFLRRLENGPRYCRVMTVAMNGGGTTRNGPLKLNLTLELLGQP